ncbi:Hypothetical protein PROPJV5_0142 [Propionibacterium ruminifibrarum]|uniref:Abortive infection C-terminus n=1 Tax=Propionibacterium ruminifibrarum TaxID=1962131 RepID=A0A375I1P9_9ACTN|nr:hypothetical protein [Propionibacterium ruminifibrarum]SPF67132.1 Hypothetical protein PROPJV5_0142 [Propionibacterium ruminifibrarum]
MALHSRRKRLQEMAEQEAQGVSFWTDEFDESFRYKVKNYIDLFEYAWSICNTARNQMLLELGKPYLHHIQLEEYADVMNALIFGPNETVPDIIEALRFGLEQVMSHGWQRFDLSEYDAFIKRNLNEHRIAYDFIDGNMCQKKSQELHASIMEPTLTLLSGRPYLESVEKAYTAALEELAQGNPADALTDAGTALQEMLKAVGCEGETLNRQFKDAKTKDVLGGEDSPLLESIEKSMSWVASVRNQKSDAHPGTGNASTADGWLMVHIVGALILRLAQGDEG